LLASIKTTKLRYFGHIMRHNCIEKDIIQGILSGKRQRGRPKTTWSLVRQHHPVDRYVLRKSTES